MHTCITSSVVDQGADDVAQGGQRQVDARGLLQPISGCVRLALPLAAGQVHQVQLAHADVAAALHQPVCVCSAGQAWAHELLEETGNTGPPLLSPPQPSPR